MARETRAERQARLASCLLGELGERYGDRQAEFVRLRTAATLLVGNVRAYLALRFVANDEQHKALLEALELATDNLAAAMAPPAPSEGDPP